MVLFLVKLAKANSHVQLRITAKCNINVLAGLLANYPIHLI